MLTLTQAAEKLGVTAATLRQQIHAGHLRGTKVGPIWTIDEEDFAAYWLYNHGRVGRGFVGRPGDVDTQHVRVRLMLAPADGRGHDAIWLQYLRQSFVLDPELTNAVPFRPSRETYEMIDLLTSTTPGGRTFEFWNRSHLARELHISEDEVDWRVRNWGLPEPIVTFRDGPIWDGQAVQRWSTTHTRDLRWSEPFPS
jgi:excisionase family DNA binding protein